MAEQDLCIKKLLQDKMRFADFCNALIFEGEQVIKPESLELLPSEAGIVITDQTGHKRAVQRRRDVIMRASDVPGICFAVLACEGQANVHYGMPVRAMMYDALDYTGQIEELEQKHAENGDISGAEFLSHLKNDDRLIPVITIVLYYGKQDWDGPVSLHQMLGLDRLNKRTSYIQEYLPDYRLNLIDARNINGIDRFRTCLQQVFSMLKYNSDKKKLYQYATEHREELKNMDKDACTALLVLLGEQKRLMKIVGDSDGEEDFDMCQAIDELIADGRKEGIRIGEQMGFSKGINEGIGQGIIQGEGKYSRLISKLLHDNRIDLIAKAAEDHAALEHLYQKYDI